MNVTSDQVQKLLSGNYSFSHLSLSMLITRWKKEYSKNKSEETLQKCTSELNGFFQKYFGLMVSDDIDIISDL